MNEGQVRFCRLYLWVWLYLVLFSFMKMKYSNIYRTNHGAFVEGYSSGTQKTLLSANPLFTTLSG